MKTQLSPRRGEHNLVEGIQSQGTWFQQRKRKIIASCGAQLQGKGFLFAMGGGGGLRVTPPCAAPGAELWNVRAIMPGQMIGSVKTFDADDETTCSHCSWNVRYFACSHQRQLTRFRSRVGSHAVQNSDHVFFSERSRKLSKFPLNMRGFELACVFVSPPNKTFPPGVRPWPLHNFQHTYPNFFLRTTIPIFAEVCGQLMQCEKAIMVPVRIVEESFKALEDLILAEKSRREGKQRIRTCHPAFCRVYSKRSLQTSLRPPWALSGQHGWGCMLVVVKWTFSTSTFVCQRCQVRVVEHWQTELQTEEEPNNSKQQIVSFGKIRINFGLTAATLSNFEIWVENATLRSTTGALPTRSRCLCCWVRSWKHCMASKQRWGFGSYRNFIICARITVSAKGFCELLTR